MAYDDKTLVRDGSGLSPAPQYFNPDEDAYEPLFGRNNAARAELYDENGDPINITGLLDGVSTALNTLADMIEDIVGDAVASPDSNTVLARLKSLEGKIDAMVAGTSPAVVQLSGSNVTDAVITIATDAKVSSEIDFRNYKYLSFEMPAAWDEATITIKGSATAGGTKVDIVNDAGVAFPAMTVEASKIYSVDLHALKIAAIPYLALVSSADQTANRTIKVMLEQ